MARTGRPVLGALGETLQNAAYQIPAMQRQNATLQQRYAEFQEEKRKTAQGQSNWEKQFGATEKYRGSMLDKQRELIAEEKKANDWNRMVDTLNRLEGMAPKPPTKSEVEGGILAGMSPEKQEQHILGSGKEVKPDASVVRALLDLLKTQRYVPKEQGVDANGMPFEKEGYYPPVTGATADSVNYITQRGQWPSQPLGVPQQSQPSVLDTQQVDPAEQWGHSTYYNWDELTLEQKQKLIGAYYKQ